MTHLFPVGAAAGTAALVVGLLVVPTTAATAPAASVRTASTAAAAAAAKSCSVGSGATAQQVVVVRSTGSSATVKACRRTATGKYVVALGPYAGHVGRNGVAKKGTKREGDGRTPGGVFKLRGGFGVKKDPGVRFSWFKADARDRWVDDSSSRYYNLHKRAPANGRWSSAERLKVSPVYDYAQVVGYNEKRRPGRGSAIFFHVDTGRATAGCVSLPRAQLLKILRWQKPGAVMTIKKKATSTSSSALRASSASLVAPAAAVAARPPYFSASRRATKADLPYSWRAGCPVGPKRLRVLTIRYWGFDKRAHDGTLVVNRSVAKDMRAAFGVLYARKFAIRTMRPVDAYQANDRRSMRADNTSAFNCRFVSGTRNWSNHAYGLAVDINPVENPWVSGGKIRPKSGAAYLDRTEKRKGLIRARTAVVRAFTSRGFDWGGYWYGPDYQHFDRR